MMHYITQDPQSKLIACLISKVDVLERMGRLDEALLVIQEAMARAAVLNDKRTLADCFLSQNYVYFLLARYDDQAKNAKIFLPLFRELGDKAGIARCYAGMGHALDNSGRYKMAIEKYSEAARLDEESDSYYDLASDLSSMSYVYQELNDYENALITGTRALKIAEESGVSEKQAGVLINIANIHETRGELNKSLECLERAMRLYQMMGDVVGEAYILHGLGRTHYLMGEETKGIEELAESIRLKEKINDQWALAASLNLISRIHCERGEIGQAESAMCLARVAALKVSNKEIDRRLAVTRAMMAFAAGDAAAANEHISQAAELALQTGMASDRSEALLLRARIEAYNNKHERAEPIFNEIIASYDELKSPLEMAYAQYYAGESAISSGNINRAMPMLESAAKTFRSAGAVGWLRKVESVMSRISDTTGHLS